MSTTYDADIIQIDISIFKKHYLSFNKKHIPETLNKKKQDIYTNHNCFHITYEANHTHTSNPNYSTQNNHKFPPQKFAPNNQIAKNRLYIITSDFTESTKIKKQFTSYLNKLTETNFEALYPKIKELLASIDDKTLITSMYSTVWDFIKKSPSELYVNILHFFEQALTQEYIEGYINDKQWYPPDYAFSQHLFTSNPEMYDKYCEYVKWRSNEKNVIKTILNIGTTAKYLDKLLSDLYDLFFDNLYNQHTKHIVHFALEQIYSILQSHSNKTIKDNLKQVDTKTLESSSKFILMDILTMST